jgi:hypothetical protein
MPIIGRAVFGMMLICVGVLGLVSGAIAMALHRARAERALRVIRLQPTRIANASQGGPVRIDGIAVAPEDGALLVAPCSDLPAVWFRVRVLRRLGSTGGQSGGPLWQPAIDEQHGTSFDVLDRGADRARVNASEAEILVDGQNFIPPENPSLSSAGHVLSQLAHERVGRFLQGRGHEWWFGDMYEEQCICPGEGVSVVGLAGRDPGPVVPTPYRDAPSSTLVLRAGPEQKLILVKPEAARRERYGVYLVGQIAVALGLASLIAGIVIRLAGGE